MSINKETNRNVFDDLALLATNAIKSMRKSYVTSSNSLNDNGRNGNSKAVHCKLGFWLGKFSRKFRQ